MTFKGFAESSARGFKSFQIQLPTKEVLARMREASNRELGYKKDNLQAYKESRREYLNTLVSNHNIQSKNLKEVQDFRNENLRYVQKWERRRWQDKVDKAKEKVTRIQQYGQQNPSPSTLESIAGLIGDFAPKLAGIIEEHKVAEAKAEKDFMTSLIGNTGLTTKQQNEVAANIEAIKNQKSEGIELQKRINEELGLTGENAITSEQFLRISNITGDNRLIRDQMLAHNGVQKYPTWFQSQVNTPLSELFPDKGYGEGETAAHVLNPNLPFDHERASNMMRDFQGLFMTLGEFGNLGDIPLSTQGHSMFASLRKHNNSILANYGRGVNQVLAGAHEVEQDQEIEVAWFQTRQDNPDALVNLRDRFARDYAHMPGGGNVYANGKLYTWMQENIKAGLISPEDVRAFNRSMADRYPDVWKGTGWPARFKELADEAQNWRMNKYTNAQNHKQIAQRAAEDNFVDIMNANPDLGNLSPQEFKEKLINDGFDPEAASRLTAKFVRGDTRQEAGSSIKAENGGLFEAGINGLPSRFIERHNKQNGSTILQSVDFGTKANHSVQLMVAHANNMYRAAYDAEYSQSRDHTRAQQYAAGILQSAIDNGEFDMSPNKHMVDGEEQQRTQGSEFHWIHAPKGTIPISDAKSKVVTRLGQLQDTNPTPEEYINKVTSKNFIPPEVVQSTIARGGGTSLASFRGHPAVKAILQYGPDELTAGYLYQQVLESYGYEGAIPDDRVLDPDEYRRSSQQTKDRLRAMEAVSTYNPYVQSQINATEGDNQGGWSNMSVTSNIPVKGQMMGKSEYIPQPGRLRGIAGNRHNISAEELSYAINTIMGEAGPDDDMYYVMAVILNRKAANPHLHIRDIVSAPEQFVGNSHGRQIDSGLLAHFMSAEGMAKTYEAQLHLGNRTQFRGRDLYHNIGDGDIRPNGRSNYYFHSPQAAGKHVRYNPAWNNLNWQSIWTGPLQTSRKEARKQVPEIMPTTEPQNEAPGPWNLWGLLRSEGGA